MEQAKRVAKNTLFLYFRMGIIMLVSLFTSRIILDTLGVEDFGIYNAVGGFVTMFSFLNSAMTSATQRFLSFEIGKRDLDQLRNVFSMSINIYLFIAFITRLKIISPLVNLKTLDYLNNVVLRIGLVIIIAVIPPSLFYFYESFYRLLVIGLFSILSTICAIYFVGLDYSEKVFINTKVKEIFSRIKFE